jgi:predicted nuclease of restriction endonuclease-like (RecB) superfamily
MQPQFTEILHLIQQARQRAYQAVNQQLVQLYWQIGEYINNRIAAESWGKSTVQQLALYLQQQEPEAKGFGERNLWRMKQFYEAYQSYPKLSALLTEISWTHHTLILSKTQSIEEKEFYLRLIGKEKYSSRQLERQLNSAVYERTMLSDKKLSPALTELMQPLTNAFKDRYIFEFLQLPEQHSETDLQKAIIINLRHFLLEFGSDFAFMGEEYRLQVGNRDFFTDLLFYNRHLNCLVAVELKITEFEPEYLGKLNFYLEALDRDVKKPHENPSIGILLCKGHDDEVVEYAISRNLSPTMDAQYQLYLPDKKLLQQKLHELFELNKPED